MGDLLTSVCNLLLSDEDIRLRSPRRHESPLPLLHSRRLLPLVKLLGTDLTPDGSASRRPEEPVTLDTRDVHIVPGVDEREPQARVRALDHAGQPLRRQPLFVDARLEHPGPEGYPLERPEDGDQSGDAVAREHGGQAAEAGDEDDPGELDPVAGARLGCPACHSGSETLAEDEHPLCRHAGDVDHPFHGGHGIEDEALFGGRARGVSEAPVVDGDDVVRGCVGEGVVGVGSPTLGDVPGVLCALDGPSACLFPYPDRTTHPVYWNELAKRHYRREMGILTIDDNLGVRVLLQQPKPGRLLHILAETRLPGRGDGLFMPSIKLQRKNMPGVDGLAVRSGQLERRDLVAWLPSESVSRSSHVIQPCHITARLTSEPPLFGYVDVLP